MYFVGKALRNPGDGKNTPTLIASCLALIGRLFEGTARRGSDITLKLLKLFAISFGTLGEEKKLTVEQSATLSNIPDNIETLESRFNLDVAFVPYAVCPACNCTYSPTYPRGPKCPVYPASCTERKAALEEPCGEALLEQNGVPLLLHEYYPFWDWFGRFIALPGIEDYGDRFCEEVSSHNGEVPSDKRDATDGRFIHELCGPAGELFVADRGAEGRWLFVLNFDSFNAEGNRKRGRTSPTGQISMTCLNLPLPMRNDPAFIYISGIIRARRAQPTNGKPSSKIPSGPSSTNSEHRYFSRPLIDDLVVGYTRGVRPYATHNSRKASVPYGRTFKVAIATAVLDLKGAREFAGLRDVGAHIFCFTCKCWHSAHLHRTDCHLWTKVDDEFLFTGAKMWRDAQVLGDRKVPEDFFGTRWSDLWRLPYWKPSRQLVVDPMHAIFLNAEVHFFRKVLGLEQPDEPGAEPTAPPNLLAFIYPFAPPPPLSSLRIPRSAPSSEISLPLLASSSTSSSSGAPLQRANSIQSVLALERQVVEEHRLSIIGWSHLPETFNQARLSRLEQMKAAIQYDVKAFRDVGKLLVELSEFVPTKGTDTVKSKEETDKLKALSSPAWIALRFVCENLAVFPNTDSPRDIWSALDLKKSLITKKEMAQKLLDWVSLAYIRMRSMTNAFFF